VLNKGHGFPVFLPQMKSPWWSALGSPQCVQLATCVSCGTPWPRNCHILPSAEASCALSCHCGNQFSTLSSCYLYFDLLLCFMLSMYLLSVWWKYHKKERDCVSLSSPGLGNIPLIVLILVIVEILTLWKNRKF
jgi:hypothetical protein